MQQPIKVSSDISFSFFWTTSEIDRKLDNQITSWSHFFILINKFSIKRAFFLSIFLFDFLPWFLWQFRLWLLLSSHSYSSCYDYAFTTQCSMKDRLPRTIQHHALTFQVRFPTSVDPSIPSNLLTKTWIAEKNALTQLNAPMSTNEETRQMTLCPNFQLTTKKWKINFKDPPPPHDI